MCNIAYVHMHAHMCMCMHMYGFKIVADSAQPSRAASRCTLQPARPSNTLRRVGRA